MKDIVKLHTSDMSQSSGVFTMKLHCEFWCRDFGGGFPEIVFVAVFFLLNKILESSPVPTTVEYLLYFPLRFSVDDYGWWVIFCFPSCDWVVQSQSKLYYVKHWIELLHLVW